MIRLALILALSSIGGSFLIHYLRNFLLKEKIKFHFDWDGPLERLCITFIVLEASHLWTYILIIIIIKSIYRLALLGFISGIVGVPSQKVRYKSELAFDLILSPAFAILLGTLFK